MYQWKGFLQKLNCAQGGANPASGDFSLSAKGCRIRGAEKGEAVADFIITGNFYTLLKNVISVSDKIIWGLPPQFGSPHVLVKDIMISGK